MARDSCSEFLSQQSVQSRIVESVHEDQAVILDPVKVSVEMETDTVNFIPPRFVHAGGLRDVVKQERCNQLPAVLCRDLD